MEIVEKTSVRVAPDDDPLEFIMSDGTIDRYGDIVDPNGWDLSNFANNPIALFGHQSSYPIGTWANVRVVNGQLRGRLKLMEAVSERLKELHAAVNGGVLRAVSVGFRPVDEPESIDTGYRYPRNELVECSLVAIPANANALQIAKEANLTQRTIDLIFGVPADKDQKPTPTGVPADRSPIHRSMTMNLPERIEQAQTSLVALKDQLHTHITAQPEGGIIAEDAKLIADELTARITQTANSLEMFKAAEAAMGAKSDPIVQTGSGALVPNTATVPASVRRPFALPAREVKPIDYIYRSVAAAITAHMSHRPITEILKATYGDDELTHQSAALLVQRGASLPATTTLAGWAAELVQTATLDFVSSLSPKAIYPRLRTYGGRYTFGRNGIVSLPARSSTPTIAGAFIAEGAPIPVRQGAFTAVTLTPKKMGVITTMTRQIAEHSTPEIESILREAMGEDTAVALDVVLIDANPATATRPAGLRNGVVGLTPTAGGGFAALVGDIKQSVSFLAAANSLRMPVWIMNPGDVASITLTQNAGGDFPFKTEVGGGTLLGYPLIDSTTLAKGTIIFLDAADFFSATGDDARFDVSDQATIHMEDTTPLPIGSTGTPTTVAAPVRSLWQTDSLGIRMLLDVNWAMRRQGVVTSITGITW